MTKEEEEGGTTTATTEGIPLMPDGWRNDRQNAKHNRNNTMIYERTTNQTRTATLKT